MLRSSSSGPENKKRCSKNALHLRSKLSDLPDAQFYFIHPDVVVGHGALAVHLEGDVQFPNRRSFRIVKAVNDSARAIYRDRDEVRLAGTGAFKLPTQAMPHFRSLRVGAGDTSVLPMQRRVPYPPGPGAVEIALRPEDELLSIQRLVHVKLQRLYGRGIGQVK